MNDFFDEDSGLKRVQIKFDKELLALIDQYREKKKHANRSETIRQMIRLVLQQEKMLK